MNLKNYTSSTPAHQTISYIEAYLAECGVSGITKQYDEHKRPNALFFHIEIPMVDPSGESRMERFTIRLPAQINAVQEYLFRAYCGSVQTPRKTREDFSQQAERTAWKIQQDWVLVQMSLIKLKQVDFLEVFMGFLWDGKQSYYQSLKGGGFKALPPSKS